MRGENNRRFPAPGELRAVTKVLPFCPEHNVKSLSMFFFFFFLFYSQYDVYSLFVQIGLTPQSRSPNANAFGRLIAK